MDWLFRKTSTNNHVMGYELGQLSIPKAGPDLIKKMCQAVDLAINTKKSGKDTAAEEAEIDCLVYALYGLTEEEIAIVEGK